MLARLWWKEARVFGPVWVILLVVAAGLDWFLFSVNREEVRAGSLTFVNLLWATLYAFASASAAFAGERESNTLGFLDALPVSRRLLWTSKTTFVLGSTVCLSLFLVAMAEVGTDRRPAYSYGSIFQTLGIVMIEAVAWGLFWSSTSKNPLLAGAMSIVSVASSAMSSDWLVNKTQGYISLAPREVEFVLLRLVLALLAFGASAAIMTWRPSRGWLSPKRSASESSRPIEPRASSTGRNLTWQTWREAWTTALVVVLLGLVVPFVLTLLGAPLDGLIEHCLAAIAGMVAGVSVFGIENASGGKRFLVHHGVRAGAVWWWKLLVWGVGMAAFVGLTLLSIRLFGAPLGGREVTAIGERGQRLGLLVTTVVDAFVVGVVCGMVIRRRITAALVGIMVLIAILPIQVGLVWDGMVPSWSYVLVPLVLLAISRAWASDWLLEPEGARPWVRLAGLIVVPFGLLGASYVTHRALGVPDVGLQFDPTTLQSPAIPPGQDAAETYRRASGLIQAQAGFYNDQNGTTATPGDFVIATGWDAEKHKVVAFWKSNQEAIELARKASGMPRARFVADLASLTMASKQGELLREMKMLGQLLALDTRERLSRGDLPGAWDDILAQFRMSLQLGTSSPTLAQMTTAIQFHHRAVGLAFDWLGHHHQTPETIRRALGDLKALPPLPNLIETIQIESSIMEQSLDLSSNELAEAFKTAGFLRSTVDILIFTKLTAAPWERLRTRRICRRLIAEELSIARQEPWQRDPLAREREMSYLVFQSSRLTRLIFPSFQMVLIRLDNEVVARRALEQAVALIAWKLDHGGKYPDKLQDIVPGLLDRLPFDPYSGRSFGYIIRSEGQTLWSLFEGLRSFPIRPGQPLLYSVGPDGKDEGGKVGYGTVQVGTGDMIFAVP